MAELAPIGLTTYTRIGHLKKAVEALRRNHLAKDSRLYVFSDGPRQGDEEAVAEVRKYLRTIDGFREVHLAEREKNGRVANNRGGMKWLLEQYGKAIWLADDNVTAPGFLRFMNDALTFYEHDQDIFSITGYCPPIKIPDHYRNDSFVLPRFCAWGIGLYPRAFEVINSPIDRAEFERVRQRRIFDMAGDDVMPMVEKEVAGELQAGDVRCMYYQLLHEKYTVYPRHSLVHNIGHDGSGEHCSASDKFHHKNLWEKSSGFHFAAHPKMDEGIRKANSEFRRIGMKMKLMLLARDAFNRLNMMRFSKSGNNR